jgi:acetyl esterase/lipase
VLVAHKGLTQPNCLYRASLSQGRPRLIYQSWTGASFSGVAPERVTLPVPGGASLPIYVWRAAARPSRGVAIMFPFVRRKAVDVSFDYSMQYVIRQGYDTIMFDFRPTTYNGEDWETRITGDDVAAALAIVDYARGTLGAPPDRIVLCGLSNATAYITLTAARMREKRGGLLLRSVVASLQSMPPIAGHHFRIAVFQGEYDPFPIPAAEASVERIYGPGSLSGPQGYCGMLKGEGHSPVFMHSKATIAAAMLRLLAAPRENAN